MNDDPAQVDYADPDDVAAAVAAAPHPVLLGLDVDGVLAPIVAHAADSRLTPGIAGALDALCVLGADRMRVLVVSGRPLGDLRSMFEFPDAVELIGSHGVERGDEIVLSAVERDRLDRLVALAGEAVTIGGDGSWLEHKPTSVALHVREADPERGATAMDWLARAAGDVDGAAVKAGSFVVELLARSGSKGEALADAMARHRPATTVFVGDDLTDEDAFAVLGPNDIAIKVGAADTIAGVRLRDPDAVLAWLRCLAELV